MLQVQKLLSQLSEKGYSLQACAEYLYNNHNVLCKLHDTDGRIILDYDQICSNKTDVILRECRGLVLNSSNWELITRGFYRFFNLSEPEFLLDNFNWNDNIYCTNKEDGTYIVLYYHNGWQVNTRFSFCEHDVIPNLSWRDLVLSAFDFVNCPALDKSLSYVFELCSPYNKVVRAYPHPKVYLTTVFNGYVELSHEDAAEIAQKIGVEQVSTRNFTSIDELQYYLAELAITDPTFEGYVLRDINNKRAKIKSLKYLELHRLANNGNICVDKNLIPLILNGEIDEVLSYFPYLKERVDYLSAAINSIDAYLENIYRQNSHHSTQKEFALAVLSATKFSSPLFTARKLALPVKQCIEANFYVDKLDNIMKEIDAIN